MKFLPIITKLESGKFKINYQELPDFELVMDFNPLIQRFNLQPPYCLVHWQAKPKEQRRWGVFDGQLDQYFSVNWNKLQFELNKSRPIEIDENSAKTVPTAVLLFDNCHAQDQGFIRVV